MNPKIYPLLAASTAVTALVMDRIYPVIAQEAVARPYIVYTPVGVSSEQFLSDPESVDYDRVQIDCWADTLGPADAVARAARQALLGNGYLVGGFSDRDPETLLYRVSFDWSLVTLF